MIEGPASTLVEAASEAGAGAASLASPVGGELASDPASTGELVALVVAESLAASGDELNRPELFAPPHAARDAAITIIVHSFIRPPSSGQRSAV
jgi:hypothetical protein